MDDDSDIVWINPFKIGPFWWWHDHNGYTHGPYGTQSLALHALFTYLAPENETIWQRLKVKLKRVFAPE